MFCPLFIIKYINQTLKLMIALPIISIVFCLAYIIFVIFKFGVPVSLSETYYLLSSKWDWLFAAWTILTSIPFCIYWFTIAVPGMKWIPVTVGIALAMIGVACCYKSGPKQIEGYEPDAVKGDIKETNIIIKKSFCEFIRELLQKFSPKEFFKYGPARLIHYFNSLVAIILTTVYICMTAPVTGVVSTILLYMMFILIGMKVDGVYNPDYSADVDNKAWIFFMEVICFLQLFIFIW